MIIETICNALLRCSFCNISEGYNHFFFSDDQVKQDFEKNGLRF